MRTSLETVFFDAVGTLIYLPKPVGEHYREVALRYGADISGTALETEFRQCWKLAPARENTGKPRPDDDKGWWRALVRQVLDGTLPIAQRNRFHHDPFFEELYAHFALPGIWAIYPEVERVLRSLKSRGLTLGIISNFDQRLYAVLEHLQLTAYFETIVISSEVGADKPDPIIFQRALAMCGVKPTESVHVGDDPKRDGGANDVGIEAFELDRPRRTLDDLTAWLDQRESRQKTLATRSDLP